MCMYKVPFGLIVRAKRAVSSGMVSGSGSGNDITYLLSLLQTQFSYSTRYFLLYAWLGISATESTFVLGLIACSKVMIPDPHPQIGESDLQQGHDLVFGIIYFPHFAFVCSKVFLLAQD